MTTSHGELDIDWVKGDKCHTLTAGVLSARVYELEMYKLYGMERRCDGEFLGSTACTTRAEALRSGEDWIRTAVESIPLKKETQQ